MQNLKNNFESETKQRGKPVLDYAFWVISHSSSPLYFGVMHVVTHIFPAKAYTASFPVIYLFPNTFSI